MLFLVVIVLAIAVLLVVLKVGEQESTIIMCCQLV